MSDELKTLELAKVYENQGYYEEAFEIYSFLDLKESSNEIKAGLERMGNQMENIERHRSDHKENISSPTHQFKLNEAPGIYFIEVSSQGKKQQFKLIKE